MEYEFRDPPRRRGVAIVVAGLGLAIMTGVAAFFAVNQARQQAEQGGLALVSIVVARQQIPARKPIEAADIELRQVPDNGTVDQGVFTDPNVVVGLIPTVAILAGQPVYANLLASQAAGGQFSILEPGETVAPDSEAWRAVSVTVPDDRAVGGMVNAGDYVDVFITAPITVPDSLAEAGRYTSDKATKITYQNVKVLQRSTSFYILRVTLAVAEEIDHMQATGTVSFSLALRPTADSRVIDVAELGETTNLIIQRHGLPIPEVYPGTGPISSPAGASPSPSDSPDSGSATP